MQRRGSWLIPSEDEWKAMLWGGLYVLAGYMLLRICLWPLLLGPFGGYGLWVKPIVLLSRVLTDFNSLIMSWGIPSLLASALCGMLGGLFVYRRLRRQARQRPLSAGDGWRAGAWIGAGFGISLAVLYIIAPYGIFPTIRRIAQEVPRLSGWGIRQYLNVLLVVAILTLFMTAVGAVVGRLLYARGIAAGVEPGEEEQRSMRRQTTSPGCVGLLVLVFFTMYFYGDVSRLISKIPLPPPAFMAKGDFGIVSQEPCGPPCFQGITPGVTTIKDAYLNLLKAGAPCQVYESRFETSAPIDGEGVRCHSHAAYISIDSRIGLGRQETDEAKVIVDSITLKPPAQVTVGQLIARYGPPDSVREYTGQDSSGVQSYMSFYYDRLQTYIEFPVQKAGAFAVAAGTAIESVTYRTAADYQKGSSSGSARQPWKGYAPYAMPTPTVPAAFLNLGDFGIVSQKPCGAPCFQGITLGVTTFQDAKRLLTPLGALCVVNETASRGGGTLTCNSGAARILVAASGDEPVSTVELSPQVQVTVGQLIAQYGPPDSLVVLSVITGGTNSQEWRSSMYFFYDRLQTIMHLADQPAQRYTVTPDTTIASVTYLTVASYPEFQIPLKVTNVPYQSWKGYGTYSQRP